MPLQKWSVIIDLYNFLRKILNMDIILMGDQNSGRSSIVKTIFHKINSKNTMLLGQTNKMEANSFKIHKLDFTICDFPNKYDLEEPAPNQQMILKNAVSLIYVIDPQADTFRSIESFISIYEYLKKKNTNNCQFFIFINKSDVELNSQEGRDEFLIKHKKKLTDEGVDPKQVNFHFTSIRDYSVYQALSKVLQKAISCSPYITKLLNKVAQYCKIQKVFVFDICSKLYLGHNDDVKIDNQQYDICSELIDIHIDISLLYGTEKKEKQPVENIANQTFVKLSIPRKQEQEQTQLFILKELDNCLCLAFMIKQSNYDRPYLIDANIDKFKEGLNKLLNETMKSLN